MSRWHVSKTTGKKAVCTATVKPCPVGKDGVHFSNEQDAEEFSQQVHEELNADNQTVSKGIGERRVRRTKATNTLLTPEEQQVVDNFSDSAKQILSARSNAGDLTVDGDSHDPQWAENKLHNAVDYARSQGNEHLVEKLKKSTSLSAGSFKLNDGSGKTVSTDTIIETHARLEDVEDKRTHINDSMKKVFNDAVNNGEDLSSVKFPPMNFNGSNEKSRVTMSVTRGLNQEKFDALPDDIKEASMSDTYSYSVDSAREKLPAHVVHKITNRVQTINYIMGKEKNIAGNTGEYSGFDNKNIKGKTTAEKLVSHQQEIGKLYSGFYATHGETKKDVQTRSDMYNSSAKQVASATNASGVYMPARSNANGALVTNSYTIDEAEAKERLTPEQLESIRTHQRKPSVTKLKAVLKEKGYSKADIDNICSTGDQKLNVRVYE